VTDNLQSFGEQENVFKLYEAIGKAQSEFADLPKQTAGQYGNQKFNYAAYHTIRKCILPALTKYGITFIQPTHSEGDKTAVTLVVSGHGAAVTSTIVFDKNQTGKDRFTQEVKFDVQLWGREHTYWRRYQLQSFFAMEGDKDADDLPEVAPVVAKPEDKPVKQTVKAEKPADKPVVEPAKAAEQSDAAPVRAEAAKPAEGKNINPRTANERLLDAKKQLNWEIPRDFDIFAKEHIDQLPGYVTATKMTNDQKQIMWNLLVEFKGVAPF